MATVLIIYYKQISEGYEDAERYKIMQKVGLDRREIKRSISSQILVVFFMPLIVSAIHVAFDFKLMTMLLSLFGLVNNRLTLLCTAGTLGAFIIIYGTVYSQTAKAYYKIVS
jgi:putative ABC transport system permease protein